MPLTSKRSCKKEGTKAQVVKVPYLLAYKSQYTSFELLLAKG
jgi:hypothetical protein